MINNKRLSKVCGKSLAGTLSLLMVLFGSSLASAGGEGSVCTGHPEGILWVKKLKDTFVPVATKELASSGTEVKFREFYGGAMLKVAGELSGLRDGVCDIGPVSTMFTPKETLEQTISYVTPFSTGDSSLVAKTIIKLHQDVPGMVKSWEKHDIQYLGAVYPSEEYVLVTKFPVTKLADLSGHKVSTAGQALRWLDGTGATAIEGNITTYRTNIETALSEGAIMPLAAVAGTKIFEVAPNVTRVGFGAHYIGAVSANKGWYDDLPEPAKAALRKAATAYTEAYLIELNQRAEAAVDVLTKAGAKVSDLPDEERQKWAKALPPLARNWATELDKAGSPGTEVLKAYMTALRAGGAKPLRDWDKE